jgi:hypothetical protein
VAVVADAAFADGVKSGEVLGPIETSAGSELFLVESRYSGILDERARAALAEVRADPSPDLIVYTARFAPTDVALATDAGWRAQAEFATAEPVRKALFETTLGLLSDPFVLDGRLALAVVSERRTAVPDSAMAARLELDGFDAWLASELAAATITRSDVPLPELAPSASPTSTIPAPTMPPLETPGLPTIPGFGMPTPVGTDAFGLPVAP